MNKVEKKVGLVQGSWDLFHIGHLRYLQIAREKCDYLVVAVDSDSKVRRRKGAGRPIVPYEERAGFIAALGIADEIIEKKLFDEKWGVIKRVHPDILIATEGTYTPTDIETLTSEYCGEVFIAPRQAGTSTTQRVRQVLAKNSTLPFIYRSPDTVVPVVAKAYQDGIWYRGINMIDNTIAPWEIDNRTEMFYATVEHAEINCLRKFSGRPIVFMVSLIPCPQCLKALAERGVTRIEYVKDSSRHWAERTKELAKTLGVELIQIPQEAFDEIHCHIS